jgi:hypothetical protein
MHIRNLLITLTTCLIASQSLAQNDENQYVRSIGLLQYICGCGAGFLFQQRGHFKDLM